MRELSRSVVFIVLTILAVHGLSYVLIGVLPDSAVVALGVFSAQDSAAEAFRTTYQTRSYLTIIYDMTRGDLGNTIDRVPVVREITRALWQSFPRMAIAFVLIFLTGILAGLFSSEDNQRSWIDKWVVFGMFLPSFFLPLFIFSSLILTGIVAVRNIGGVGLWIGCAITIATTPVMLIYIQSKMVMRRLLTQPFARRYRSIGFNENKVRIKLLRNMLDEVAPTAEKLITAMLTQVILAETIFGLEGIGAITVRAVRRTDINLLLGIVLLFACIIGLLRVLSVLVRVYNRGWR